MTKQRIESQLAAEYKEEGYIPHYNSIDDGVACEEKCEECGKQMSYIGLKKVDREEFSGQTQSSYIAIAHCYHCGHEFEF